MAISLEIMDGDPWYLSPDIWVVPGGDPLGARNLPTVGEPAYLWALVHNTGDQGAPNARVNYYWANPSLIISQANAILVGTSYVTLAAGESKEVLCLTPWLPSWINNGHECLVVEVFHPDDPIERSPDESFSPANDRHVAQKNIGVLQV